MLSVPVTLRKEHNSKKLSVQVVTCCMPAKATVLDLQKSILAQLGQVAITGLTYRGSEPGLSSPLQDCAAVSTMAPRFQISYEDVHIIVYVKLPCGPRLQLTIRARSSIKDLKEQLKARLVEDIFRNHRLVLHGSPRLPAMLCPDSELDLERQLRFAIECADPDWPHTLHTVTPWPSDTPAHVLHSLGVQGFALKGGRHLNWSASLASGGVKDRSQLRIAPRTNNNLCLLVQDHTSDAAPHHIIPVELAQGASLAALSAMLQQKTGIVPHAQRLLFAGERLLDSQRSLADLHLQDGDMLHLCLEQTGGSTGPPAFATVSSSGALQELVFSTFSTPQPAWRHCCFGINVEGLCMKPSCPAYKEMVIDCIGMYSFNLLQDMACCPICQQDVKPVACALVGCAWMYDGRRVGPDGAVDYISSDWQAASSTFYHKFQEAGDIASWSSLVITVRRRARIEPCGICFEQILEQPTADTPCMHAFHADCLAAWHKFAGRPSCPQCDGGQAAVVLGAWSQSC